MIIVGNRVGFGTSKFAEPHNILVTYMGMSMLWVGWFGFNAGSAYGANARAAFALLATQVSQSNAPFKFLSLSSSQNPSQTLFLTFAHLPTITISSFHLTNQIATVQHTTIIHLLTHPFDIPLMISSHHTQIHTITINSFHHFHINQIATAHNNYPHTYPFDLIPLSLIPIRSPRLPRLSCG